MEEIKQTFQENKMWNLLEKKRKKEKKKKRKKYGMSFFMEIVQSVKEEKKISEFIIYSPLPIPNPQILIFL